MAIRNAFLIISCVLLGACMREKRWGGSSGSQVLPSGVPYQLCHALQGDTYTGPYDPSKNRPLFLVLWKAHRGGEAEYDQNNRLKGIHGHNIAVSFTDKAVYALQPDHTLKRLPLSAAETDQILQSFNYSITADHALVFDDLWNKSVIPGLSIVEDPKWIPPPIPAKP